jgi:hypothetical protein
VNESSTAVVIGDAHFDMAGIGDWAADNLEIFLIFAFVAFTFWIFRKGAFAEKFLEYRLKSRELDAKQLDDSRAVADILRRHLGPDEPLLPFDDLGDEQE